MKLSLSTVVTALSLMLAASGAVGCAAPEGDDEVTADNQAVVAAQGAEALVRAYYASQRKADPTADLNQIFDDRIVLEAPVTRIFKLRSQIVGKKDVVSFIAGGASILGKAQVREVVVKGDLVIARIDLPLPNGDLLTQVEFFETRNNKITKFQSYYDGVRLIEALPAVLVDQLKSALGL